MAQALLRASDLHVHPAVIQAVMHSYNPTPYPEALPLAWVEPLPLAPSPTPNPNPSPNP